MSLLLDVKLALSQSIPDLDSLVTGARHDLPVVSTEADRQNVGRVANETTRCDAGMEIPKSEGVVPRGRQGELAVRRDDNVGNKVVMAVQNSFWVSVRVFVAGELPHDDSFVCNATSR